MITEYLLNNPCKKLCALPCDICVNFAIHRIVAEKLGEEKVCEYKGSTTFCGVFDCEPSEGCTGKCDGYRRFNLRCELQIERRKLLGIDPNTDESLPF